VRQDPPRLGVLGPEAGEQPDADGGPSLHGEGLFEQVERRLLEVPEEEADEARELVRQIMEDALALEVPLVADAHLGSTWAEVH
jgi:hypothetical protein